MTEEEVFSKLKDCVDLNYYRPFDFGFTIVRDPEGQFVQYTMTFKTPSVSKVKQESEDKEHQEETAA